MNRLFIAMMFIVLTLHSNFTMAQTPPSESKHLKIIAWSPDGTRIAGVYGDATVSIWSIDDLNDPIVSFQPELADEILWTPDSQYLIVQGKKSTEGKHLAMQVTKWDTSTATLTETLFTFELDSQFEFNPYGYVIFPVLAFDSSTEQSAFSFRSGVVLLTEGHSVLYPENPTPSRYIHDIEWHTRTGRIAIVYGGIDSYNIQVFDLDSDTLELIIVQGFQYYINDIAWDFTGTHLATASGYITGLEGWSNVGIYDVREANDEVTYRLDDADRWWWHVQRPPAPIAWHPRKLILAMGTEDAIEFYDPEIEDALFSINVERVIDLSWSPDTSQIASVLMDGTIEIWDVPFK